VSGEPLNSIWHPGALEARYPHAAAHLDDAREDILASTAFPREIWRQVWSNNPRSG